MGPRGNRPGSLLAAIAALAVLCGAAVDASAHGSCTGARMRNVAKRCRGIARCYIAVALGRDVLDPCVSFELQQLERNFHETMIYPDCHPFGDPPDVIAGLKQYTGHAATLLQLDTDRCSRAKMEAAGKLCARLLKNCEAPAEVEGVPVDPACVDAERALMAKLFNKDETRDACTTVDDEGNVQGAVQNAVGAAVNELDNP